MSLKIFISILFSIALISCKENPSDIDVTNRSKQSISGIVLGDDNNLPLSDVTVELVNIGQTITNQSGNFSFSDVSTGSYALSAYNKNYYLNYYGDITLTEGNTNNNVVIRMRDGLVDAVIDYSSNCENVNYLIGNNNSEATLANGSDQYIIVDMGQNEGIPSSSSKIFVQGYADVSAGNIHCIIYSSYNPQGPWTEEGTVHIWPKNLRGIQDAFCNVYSSGNRYIKITGSYYPLKLSRMWFEQ